MVRKWINHNHDVSKFCIDDPVPVVSVMLRPNNVDLVVTKVTHLTKEYSMVQKSVPSRAWVKLTLLRMCGE